MEILLADAIDELRNQLKTAAEKKDENGLMFVVEEAAIELKVAATKSAEGGGKVKWLVIEIGAQGKFTAETSHTVKLKLSPVVKNNTGDLTRLQINDTPAHEPE